MFRLRKLGVIFIIALMFGSTLVAAGFLDSVTGALSLPTWFKARTIKPVCTAQIETSGEYEGGYKIMAGQCAYVNNKMIKLETVFSSGNRVIISVNGDTQMLGLSSSVDSSVSPYVELDGLSIKLGSIGLNLNNPSDKSQQYAVLYISESSPCTKTVNPSSDGSYYLITSQCALVNGKMVKLIDVGSASVVVEVDGTPIIVTTSSSQTVNGVEVKVSKVYSGVDRADSSAVLFLSTSSGECTNIVNPGSDSSYKLLTSQCAVVNGKRIKLIDVGSASVVVEVDGVSKIVTISTPQKLNVVNVNGVQVTVRDVFTTGQRADAYAILYLEVNEVSTENQNSPSGVTGAVAPAMSNCRIAQFWGKDKINGNDACKKIGKSCVFVNRQYEYFDYVSNNCKGAKKINMVYYLMEDCQSQIVDSLNCQGGGTTEMHSGGVNMALCC